MPIWPWLGSAFTTASKFAKRPIFFCTLITLFSPTTAIPAESYPRYSNFSKPSSIKSAAFSNPIYPTIPHMVYSSLINSFLLLLKVAFVHLVTLVFCSTSTTEAGREASAEFRYSSTSSAVKAVSFQRLRYSPVRIWFLLCMCFDSSFDYT